MFGIRGRKSLLIVAGLLGLFFIFSVFVAPRINPPGPTVHTSLIFAGGVSRTIVGSKEPKVGRPGTFVPPYQPHHIDFASSNGPVDVYVVPFSDADVKAKVDEMLRLTEQLQAGQPPEEYLAKGSGNQGRIDLAGWWPFGWAKSLVLIHSQNKSEVRLVVHYGPNSTDPPEVPNE